MTVPMQVSAEPAPRGPESSPGRRDFPQRRGDPVGRAVLLSPNRPGDAVNTPLSRRRSARLRPPGVGGPAHGQRGIRAPDGHGALNPATGVGYLSNHETGFQFR